MAGRARGISLLVIGTVAIAGISACALVQFRAHRAIARFTEEANRPLNDAEIRRMSRPAVFSPPLDGNGFSLSFPRLANWTVVAPHFEEKEVMPEIPPIASMGPIEALRKSLHMRGSPKPDDSPFTRSSLDAFYIEQNGAIQDLIRRHRDYEALDLLTIWMGTSQDMARVTGTDAVLHRKAPFANPLWMEVLASHRLTAPQLKELASRFDALEQSAPALPELLEADRLRLRKAYTKWVESGFEGLVTPSWVPGSFTRIRAEAYRWYDEEFDFLRELGSLPFSQRRAAADLHEVSYRIASTAAHFNFGYFGERLHLLLTVEPQWASRRLSVRIALALARFEVDEGRLPEQLNDLVPRYLSSLPPSMPDGGTLKYVDRVFTATVPGETPEVWKVGRGPR